jgi:hypothetical protein
MRDNLENRLVTGPNLPLYIDEGVWLIEAHTIDSIKSTYQIYLICIVLSIH